MRMIAQTAGAPKLFSHPDRGPNHDLTGGAAIVPRRTRAGMQMTARSGRALELFSHSLNLEKEKEIKKCG